MSARPPKIAIIGPYPPPFGGISIHVQRVLAYLKDDPDVVFFCESKESMETCKNAKPFFGKLRYLQTLKIIFSNFDVIHHHSPDNFLRVWLSFLGFFHSGIYLHIHGSSLEDFVKTEGLLSWLQRRLLRNVHILSDNSRITSVTTPLKPLSLSQIDAFLPPPFSTEVLERFEAEVKLPQTDFLCSMCGWFTTYQGADLYGFDLALDALVRLREEGKDLKIVASVNGVQDQKLYDDFLKRRSAKKMDEHFLLVPAQREELWPLYIHSKVFLRPTNTDGSSVAIKEALWFETPVIASDCVPRPENIQIFKNRDFNDFYRVLSAALNQPAKSNEEKIQIVMQKRFQYPLFEKIYKRAV